MKEALLERVAHVKVEADRDLASCRDVAAAEACRVRYLGRKGIVAELLSHLGTLDPSDRRDVGRELNLLKSGLEQNITQLLRVFHASRDEARLSAERVDISLPGRTLIPGPRHPVRLVMDEIVDIFQGFGFSVCDGPEVETDYYNFEALNVPADHPARDMQDTFYTTGGKLLRTHTSPVQIRVMERERPPIAMIAPGAVYRRDTFDASHSPMFHQVEGLVVDHGITFGSLKGLLSLFWRELFGEKCRVRFRPSFFPFTEPSAEVAIGCVMCEGKGCRVCKQSGWLEVMGCGMVDPNVFRAVKYDPKKVTGFAFGLGVERIAMLKYGINDIRLFFENDLRFLEQFS